MKSVLVLQDKDMKKREKFSKVTVLILYLDGSCLVIITDI